jgi:hypothetical protein
VLACIVAAEARYSQRRPAIRGKKFFGPGDDSLLTAAEAVGILRVALLETFMARAREMVAAILTSCLLMTPVWGASSSPLATVVASDRASIGGAGAAVGTTIFAGDNLRTADAGSVQLRTASARFQLAASSAATVNEEGGMPQATLLLGSATFSTANAKAFTLNAATAVIKPKSDEPTIGQVTILSAKQLLVKCTRGALTITVGDDSREIAEGGAFRVVLDPAESEEAQNQPPPQGSGTKGSGGSPLKAAKSRFMWYAIAAVGVVSVIAVHEALESPDRP